MSTSAPLNFLPEDYLAKRSQQRTNIVCMSLFAVVMVGLLAAWLLQSRREAAANQVHDAVSHRIDQAGKQLHQLEQMQSRKEAMMHKATVTATLLERHKRSFLLALLTNSLPKGCSLLSIELATKTGDAAKAALAAKTGGTVPPPPAAGLSGRAAPPAGATDAAGLAARVESIRVIGLATNDKLVSRYMAALGSSTLFHQVDLTRSEEYVYQQQTLRRFILQIDLDQQAEVTDEMVQSQQIPAVLPGDATITPQRGDR